MPVIRGIVVSVGEWYGRTLDICLIRNMRHMTECLVVTAPGDPAIEVARQVPGVRVLETTAFTDYGAKFNKGLAMEQGFDVMGRHGWILIHDADILFPDCPAIHNLMPGYLHGAKRHIIDDPAEWSPVMNWTRLPLARDGGPIGFFQLFHADDPAVKDKRPWYDVSFPHAGGCDAYFIEHWPSGRHHITATNCLHFGPKDHNWFGTDQDSRDIMGKFVTRNEWWRAAQHFTPDQVERAGEIPDRIQVPGYAPSTFELPFVRRFNQKFTVQR